MNKLLTKFHTPLLATMVSGFVVTNCLTTHQVFASTVSSQTVPTNTQLCSTTSEAMFPSAHVDDGTEASTMMPSHQIEVPSSVQVSRDVLREAYQASRDAYTKKLQKYAKVSPEQAKKAVISAHPGMKVEGLQLRNIRTSLIYASVVSDDQDKYLVIVDAGNGKILMDRRLETHHERVFASHE